MPVHAGEDLGPGLLRRIERDLKPCLGKGTLEEIVKTYQALTSATSRDGRSPRSASFAAATHRSALSTRRRIVEAMELFIDTARVARIVDDVKLLTFPKMSSGEQRPY